MYNFSPSAPPLSPPPPYAPQIGNISSPVMFSRSFAAVNNDTVPVQQNIEDSEPKIIPYESMDETLEKYKGVAVAAIAGLALISFAGSFAALYIIFAGFTLIPTMGAVIDDQSKKTNLTFLFGTVGTMVALYQTDTMKQIMDATVAKMPAIIWDWDNMSNTTHEFLTFNVAFTLSLVAGIVAQGLVWGAIEAKDQHSRNKLRMQ